MKKKLLLLLGIIIIGSILAYNYIYQDHRNIETEQAELTVAAKTFTAYFTENLEASEAEYLNKTIEVSGIVTEISDKEVTIDNAVSCSFSTTDFNNILKLNHNVSIKGRCIGFDDLLEIVKLDQCIITTKN